jgi:hypothetical protein
LFALFIDVIVGVVEREKRRSVLQQVFVDRTGCSSWEEAERAYRDYTHVVDNFIGMITYFA